MDNFTVELLGIGNELLNGRTANTNAQWLCGEIYSLGGTVLRIVNVPDDRTMIKNAVQEALSRDIDWILTTGGLGPTYDDMTLEGISEALGVVLEEDERAMRFMISRLNEIKHKGNMPSAEMTPSRAKMGMLPKGSIPLENAEGMAPGVLINVGRTRIACMPGVPTEMRAIFLDHLASLMAPTRLQTVTVDVEVVGKPEALLAPLLRLLASEYSSIYVKSHPGGNEGRSRVIIQLTGRGGEGIRQVNEARDKLLGELSALQADFRISKR